MTFIFYRKIHYSDGFLGAPWRFDPPPPPWTPHKLENRAFGCRVAPFFTKVAITLEPNAFLESQVGISFESGAGDSENLS